MIDLNDRIEGEIKTHEKEEIRKARIRKYGNKPLLERVKFMASIYTGGSWTADEILQKLTSLDLLGTDTVESITFLLESPDGEFLKKK